MEWNIIPASRIRTLRDADFSSRYVGPWSCVSGAIFEVARCSSLLSDLVRGWW